jgi:CubicO group peptidase (beta-lactamase class C family)
VLEFVEAADQTIDSLHSLMIVRHGAVVAEGWWAPYAPELRHELYSLSKSFTSTAVGFAIAEGKLALDDPVTKFFPDEVPTDATSQLKEMRVRDLLSMATGHQTEPKLQDDESWTKAFLKQSVPFKPGTHFLYNTPATYMLSAIVQKQTGEKVVDYLAPRLFEPLGIRDAVWGTSPQDVSLGGYGLSVKTEDIAKFGQLYLQRGEWNGRQLLSNEWIDLATSRQVSNGSNPKSDWDQGYGYQFWRCRHGYYRGDGAFGQYCIVMPDLDAVVAITSGVKDMQAVLNLVWTKLNPAFAKRVLGEDDAGHDALREKLSRVGIPYPKESSTGQNLRRELSLKFGENDRSLQTAELRLLENGNTLISLGTTTGEERIECGSQDWVHGQSGLLANQPAAIAVRGVKPSLVAARGVWLEEHKFVATICWKETPYVWTLEWIERDGKIALKNQSNVSFGGRYNFEIDGTKL